MIKSLICPVCNISLKKIKYDDSITQYNCQSINCSQYQHLTFKFKEHELYEYFFKDQSNKYLISSFSKNHNNHYLNNSTNLVGIYPPIHESQNDHRKVLYTRPFIPLSFPLYYPDIQKIVNKLTSLIIFK